MKRFMTLILLITGLATAKMECSQHSHSSSALCNRVKEIADFATNRIFAPIFKRAVPCVSSLIRTYDAYGIPFFATSLFLWSLPNIYQHAKRRLNARYSKNNTTDAQKESQPSSNYNKFGQAYKTIGIILCCGLVQSALIKLFKLIPARQQDRLHILCEKLASLDEQRISSPKALQDNVYALVQEYYMSNG